MAKIIINGGNTLNGEVKISGAKNAVLPIISVIAVQLGHKFGGSLITESVFAINGLGRLALLSILGADIPTVQILIFVFAITFIVFNLLSDILNAYLDPRLRL